MNSRDRLSLALLAIAAGIAVFAIGGATWWAQAITAIVAAVALVSVLRSKRTFERRPPFLILLVGACAWTLIQWLPLPGGLVSALSPTLDGLRADGAALAGVSVASTLSMDPPTTLRALTFLVTLSGIALVALRLAISERGRYALMSCVAGLAGLTAIVTGVHKLVGATSLYGVYRPSQLPPILGPLLNTNHLGCLMAVGVVASVGLIFYPKQKVHRRVGWAAVAAACLFVTTATYSRGAIVGLAAGLVVTFATIIIQRLHVTDDESPRQRRSAFVGTTLPLVVMVACGLTVAVYLGAGTVMQQLESTTLSEIEAPRSKYAAWRSSFELVGESPWVGVGRGAFESTFTRVHPASAFSTFSHPENESVQAVVEWGIPATLVLFGIGAWMLLLAARRWKDGPLAAGAFGALAVVAFQSNFDFGMELLGIAIPVTIIAATVAYVPMHQLSSSRVMRSRVLRVVHIVAVLAGGLLLFGNLTRTIADDHHVIRETTAVEVIRDSIAAHPLDYLGYAKLTEQLLRVEDPQAVSLLNHALRLHPTHPGLHWIAARLLLRSRRLSQVESEYAMAVRYSVNPRPVIAELVKVLPADRAARAIPVEMHLDTMTRSLLELKRTDVALAWLERVRLTRSDPRADDGIYFVAMEVKNYAVAEEAARRRCRGDVTPRCRLEIAGVLVLAGKHAQIIEELREVGDWQGRHDQRIQGWLLLCDAHAALGQLDDAHRCLHQLDVAGIVPPENREVHRRRNTWPRPAPAGTTPTAPNP